MAPKVGEKKKTAKKSSAKMPPSSVQEGPSQGTSKSLQVIRSPLSKEKEETEDTSRPKPNPRKSYLLSMFSTLRNRCAPHGATPPEETLPQSSSSSSLLKGFQIFSPSRRSGFQTPTSAKNESALKARMSDVVEEVGSRLKNMSEILKACCSDPSCSEEGKETFLTIAGDLRAALSETEEMVSEVIPFIAANMSSSELQLTLRMLTRKLLEVRELLKTGLNYGGGFSNLDVQLAFFDAKKQLRKAQDVATKIGPLPISSSQ